MSYDTVISVDPGAGGGIAWKDAAGVHCVPMPETRGDCISFLRELVAFKWDGKGITNQSFPSQSAIAYHEKISGYIPDGGPSMMFQFGANCERVGCILETLGVRIIEVTPQAWQKELAMGKKGFQKSPPKASPEEKKAVKQANARAKTEWKNKLKSEAQRRFPGLKITLKSADALLILDYALRRESQPTTGDLFA